MLFNRGATFAVVGAVLAIGGAVYTVISSTRSQPALPPTVEAGMDMAGPNNEEEFHRRVNELNATAPGAPAKLPYGLILVGVGAVSLGVGVYQMKMSRA
jgi:hypothetical protein